MRLNEVGGLRGFVGSGTQEGKDTWIWRAPPSRTEAKGREQDAVDTTEQ